jgi:hypothetical protein
MHTLSFLAALRERPPADLERTIEANAARVFGLP